jgi:hypothetical protein
MIVEVQAARPTVQSKNRLEFVAGDAAQLHVAAVVYPYFSRIEPRRVQRVSPVATTSRVAPLKTTPRRLTGKS